MIFADATNYDLLDLFLKAAGAVCLFYTALRSQWNAGHLKGQDTTLAKQDAKLDEIHEAVAVNATALADHAEKVDDAARAAASLAARQAVADHAARQERPRSDFTRP